MSKKINCNGKICFIIPYISGGGAERVVSVLASTLADSGLQVSIIKYYSTDNEYIVSNKVKIISLTQGGANEYNKYGYIKKIKTLRSIIKKEQPEFIIPFLPHVAVHSFFATIGIPVKDIQTVRAAPNLSPSNIVLRLIRNYLVYRSYATFVQTIDQKHYFNRHYWGKIKVIPNPISEEMFEIENHSFSETVHVVSAGRLAVQKNFPMVIKAVNILYHEGYNVILSIFGEGEQRNSLQEMIDLLNANDCCRLCGYSDNMANVYKNCDIFVLSSNYEGLPNTLMEAMAAGVACISTDCKTGPRDLLNNKNGLLVPVNDVNALVKALKYMLDNPEKAKKMGMLAQESARQKYSPNIINDLFIKEMLGDLSE